MWTATRILAVPPRPDTLHLRVFQTRLSDILNDGKAASALDEVGREADATPDLPAALLHPPHGPAPRLLLERDVTINTADKEGFFYQKLDLLKLGVTMPTGLYLVDVKHATKTVCSWLLVTDTALIVKRAKSQLVAFAVDMRSGCADCRQHDPHVSERAGRGERANRCARRRAVSGSGAFRTARSRTRRA